MNANFDRNGLIKNVFGGIERNLQKAVTARQGYKKAVAKIPEQSEVYTSEELARQREKTKQQYRAALAAIHADIEQSLNVLRSNLEEKHATLDLNNPAWQTALQLIQAGATTAETIEKLNSSFSDNQPALRALKEVYKKHGVHGGNIDRLMYDPGATFDKLQREARQTFAEGNTTLNTFASSVGKVAKFEGLDFNTSPDPDGFADAFARGAGLAVVE